MTSRRSVALAAPTTKGRRGRTAGTAAANATRLSAKAGAGLELSIDWATKILQDEESADWAKAQAMTFFAKLQHLIAPVEGEQAEQPIDRFMKLMAEIRRVPKPVEDQVVSVTEDDDEELEEEEPARALFEAAPS